jgi:hypothetical protein
MISAKFSVTEVLNEQARYFSKCSIQIIGNEGQGLFGIRPWGGGGGKTLNLIGWISEYANSHLS